MNPILKMTVTYASGDNRHFPLSRAKEVVLYDGVTMVILRGPALEEWVATGKIPVYGGL